MKFILLALFILIHPSAAWSQSTRDAIPNSLGRILKLGEDRAVFEKRFKVETSRCASCYRGEELAEVVVPSSAIAEDLSRLGLIANAAQTDVSVYFSGGRLNSIYVGGLGSSGAPEAIALRFGRGRVVQKTALIEETEWSDRQTRIRLTKWESEFQLIIAATNSRTRSDSNRKR